MFFSIEIFVTVDNGRFKRRKDVGIEFGGAISLQKSERSEYEGNRVS